MFVFISNKINSIAGLLTVFLILSSALPTQAQSYCNAGARFSEIPVFADTTIAWDSAVVYGKAYTYQDDTQTLILNIFYPDTLVDTFRQRPLIVLLHGGGFTGGSLKGLNTDCREFAKRGFVATTIEYRLGWTRGNTACTGDPVSQRQALYRGLQDEHAAIRFLVAHAAKYRIDTAWIFAGGTSAGAFASANLAFLNQQDVDTVYPDLRQTLGAINSSGNDYTNSFALKGLFHNWGSVLSLDAITPDNAIPIVGFAGALDNISPIDSGYWAGCTNFTKMYGTRAIYQRLTQLGVCAEITVQADGGHGVWKDTPEQDLFRIQRAVCFFKSLFCGTCTSHYATDSVAANCALISSAVQPSLGGIRLSAFPNPFTNRITLHAEQINDWELTLFNALGGIIWRGKEIAQQDFSALPAGIYFLQISDRQSAQILKLVK